ncbi:uncharacterized protein LOC105071636 isoform X2 [Camelus bactrianus]|uniref:Uncharacterized protein LOC105071636 isoform X2 n=1 Tax=Camelus bactrianus TaxID=9837 RepID=A0AC58NN23_CAMBA
MKDSPVLVFHRGFQGRRPGLIPEGRGAAEERQARGPGKEKERKTKHRATVRLTQPEPKSTNKTTAPEAGRSVACVRRDAIRCARPAASQSAVAREKTAAAAMKPSVVKLLGQDLVVERLKSRYELGSDCPVEQHDAEVEHLTEVLKEGKKKSKRLRSSFDALKELNDSFKKQTGFHIITSAS